MATFDNDKKTFLQKLDKSKKGEVDARVQPVLRVINGLKDYYSTSSCSGRVYFWKGSGKKNEIEWINVSHDPIGTDFFGLKETAYDTIWLRLEPLILHVACKDLEAATRFLQVAQKVYKKSSILTVSKKIIVEVRGSEFVEMPFFFSGIPVFSGDLAWLERDLNTKLQRIWKGTERLQHLLETSL